MTQFFNDVKSHDYYIPATLCLFPQYMPGRNPKDGAKIKLHGGRAPTVALSRAAAIVLRQISINLEKDLTTRTYVRTRLRAARRGALLGGTEII